MIAYKICVVGGHCGVRMMVVAQHVDELLQKAGYACQVTHQSLWDHPTPPYSANLILELLPAYTEAEAGCPVVNIKPLLRDLDDPQTVEKIFERVRQTHPLAVSQPVSKLNIVF